VKRIVQPELLDTLSPADPRAIRSRRDLRRVNAWMQNHSIMARALKNNFAGRAPEKIIELGAGDGNILLQVARKMNFSGINATLLDLQKNVADETIVEFQKLNWRVEPIVADVFDWLQTENSNSEIVIANLFLHHFDDARLAELLEKISGRTKLFIAVEPRRFRFPFLCAQMLRAIGCNYVTLHDAEISIRAGFCGDELSALWPDNKNWQLTESRAGWFSHLFIARKIS
jgi:2-polyprenyl-3-methyl-5-hydroxy-6-metoxy-1,4-benzoquinol methylase